MLGGEVHSTMATIHPLEAATQCARGGDTGRVADMFKSSSSMSLDKPAPAADPEAAGEDAPKTRPINPVNPPYPPPLLLLFAVVLLLLTVPLSANDPPATLVSPAAAPADDDGGDDDANADTLPPPPLSPELSVVSPILNPLLIMPRVAP